MRKIKNIFFITLILLTAGLININNITALVDNFSEETLIEFDNEKIFNVNDNTSPIEFIDKGQMTASWYGPKFHGKVTANGEIYNQMALTAAHKSLPFGTMLRLTNEKNGKSVIVRINDRGPYIKGRQIDLSKAAAIELGAIERGVVKVKVEKLVLQKNNTPYYAVN